MTVGEPRKALEGIADDMPVGVFIDGMLDRASKLSKVRQCTLCRYGWPVLIDDESSLTAEEIASAFPMFVIE